MSVIKTMNRVLLVAVALAFTVRMAAQAPIHLPLSMAGPAMKQVLTEESVHARLRELMGGAPWERASDNAADFIVKTYGPVVIRMPFAEDQKRELLRLLTARWMAVRDARSELFKKYDEQHRRDPTLPPSLSHDISETEKKAGETYDTKINALVGAEWASVVKQMGTMESDLSKIAYTYAASLESDNCPLSALQRFELAAALHWLGEKRKHWIVRRDPDSARQVVPQPLNAAGVTNDEERALDWMRRGGLSLGQLQAMRRAFIFEERAIHRLPIEWERECDIPENAERLIAKAQGEDGEFYGRIEVKLRGSAKARLKPRSGELQDERVFCAMDFEFASFSKEGTAYLMVGSGVALFYEGRLAETRDESGIVWVRRKPQPKRPRRPKAVGCRGGARAVPLSLVKTTGRLKRRPTLEFEVRGV